MAANKFPGIRAATCLEVFPAHQSEDSDGNVMWMGAHVTGPELAIDLLGAYMRATFSGLERHRRRLEKTKAIKLEF